MFVLLMTAFSTVNLQLPLGKSIFFASDFHLGSLKGEKGKEHERVISEWLKSVRDEAACLFLVGDVFDYWFEYKYVVHKGSIRFFGRLAEFADAGIPIYYFPGNHDMWVRDYFAAELDAVVSRAPVSFNISSAGGTARKFLVGHGDGLGPGDSTYKLLKVLFESRLARFLFRQVHPDLTTRLAFAWSGQSRAANNRKGEEAFKGNDQEWLYQYCLEVERQEHHDCYVFGHRHLPLDMEVGVNSRYINLGEWFSPASRLPFGRFDGTHMELLYYR